jgi:polyribonucleotide nucleotidyltransferase
VAAKQEEANAAMVKDTSLSESLIADTEAQKRMTDMVVEAVLAQGYRQAFWGVDTLRMDGRTPQMLRPLQSKMGPFPSGHGTATFARGETNILATTTLGSLGEARERQAVTGVPDVLESFFLHYDFPPYSTGSVGSMVPNRRMVGHGNLAERAMLAVIPDIADFPYSVRVLCECTSSSGSSSMASTTAASMALIDAGVPIRDIVAGISIGLIQRPDTVPRDDSAMGSREGEGGDDYRFIADILGSEDYFGAMDFKIAGTRNGVTAAQMDVKVAEGIPVSIVIGALAKAAQRRNKIIHHATKATTDRAGNLSLSVSVHLPNPNWSAVT